MKGMEKKKKKQQLALEDYIAFFHNPDRRNFTLNQVNEVISMHGFCKLKTKAEVTGDLKSLGLMDPTRSTLGDRKLSLARANLTVEELKADIRSIGWEECPIGSVMYFGSEDERSVDLNWKKTKKRTKRLEFV